MRHLACAALALLPFAGCKKTVPVAADPPLCAEIRTLANLMDCRMAGYTQGRWGDEVAFRQVLAQLRELAPPASNFNQGEHPWYQIVDGMLVTRQYDQGCKDCHAHYLKLYRAQYDGTEIPWQEPTAAK